VSSTCFEHLSVHLQEDLLMQFYGIVCLLDRAPCIIWIISNTMHCLSSVYCVITPLHISGVSAAHHQEVECIYVANGACYTAELTAIGPGWNSSITARPGNSQLRSVTSTIRHTYSLHCTSWWWGDDTPETCRGMITQWTEDKQCIVLFTSIIHISFVVVFYASA
jgi:hypothetical protein